MGAKISSIQHARDQLDREVAHHQTPPVEAYQDEPRLAEGFTDTDIANAVRLATRHGVNLRFTDAAGWLVWDGARWREDRKCVAIQALAKETALSIFDEIKRASDRDAMMKHAKHSQSKKSIDAMLWLARSESGIPAELTDFDADPMLFNVANGTIDLRTSELRPHRREDLLSRITPISFDSEADYDRWDSFLWRVLDKDEELYHYARRLSGYLLTGKTNEQVLHFLYGLGANGKSVFCEVLEALLGDYAVVVSPELVMVRRHGGIPNDIARLRGVRAAFMNETSQGSRFDEAKLKDLTGGDTLTGRFLHQEFFDFPPTHKLIIRGNHKPTINGTDEGIWRRLRLIPFLVSIPPAEQDLALVEKLREELPGILRWAVQGCIEWQREGLKPPAVIVDAVRAYREESDTLGRFIDDCCNTSSQLAQVKAGVFFQHYQQFAEHAGERWMPAKELPHEMQRRGFEWKRTKLGGIYYGIELTVQEDPRCVG
jgi:putative DNA primase/helicase